MSEPGAREIYADTALAFTFGQRVRRRRLCSGLSVGALAAAAETTDEVVTRCEAGGVNSWTPVAGRIAAALGLDQPSPTPPPRTTKKARVPQKRR